MPKKWSEEKSRRLTFPPGCPPQGTQRWEPRGFEQRDHWGLLCRHNQQTDPSATTLKGPRRAPRLNPIWQQVSVLPVVSLVFFYSVFDAVQSQPLTCRYRDNCRLVEPLYFTEMRQNWKVRKDTPLCHCVEEQIAVKSIQELPATPRSKFWRPAVFILFYLLVYLFKWLSLNSAILIKNTG